MNIRTLQQKKADLARQARSLLESAGAEGLTAEQKAQYESLKAQIASVNELIEAHESQLEIERTLAVTDPVPDFRESARVEVGAPNSDSDPKGGFRDHRDFLIAVMDAGAGRRLDPRLRRFKATQGSDEQQAGQDPYGGYFVPVAIAPGVLTLQPEDDPITPLTTNVPMTAPTVKLNARVDKNHATSVSGGLTVARRPETVDGSSSRMAFEQVTLEAHELFGMAYATETILTDSPQSFIAILAAGFRDEFAGRLMEEYINGSGVGEFLGVLKSPCLITITKETGQAANTIVTENIDKMAAQCWRYGSAIWLANHGTRPQLRGLVRAVGTGGSVVNYFQTNPGGQETLDGRPIFFTERCSALSAVGDLIVGNWSEYLTGMYQPLQQAESIHVRFAANERAFKFWLRNDGKPWWSSVFTPKRGSTLSPFVTLGAR